MFRSLDENEQAQMKAWARANYKPGTPINPTWHPALQAECEKMNGEWRRVIVRVYTKDDRLMFAKNYCESDGDEIARLWSNDGKHVTVTPDGFGPLKP
jgi:hypothetical protein